jgi:hypothetical protein
MSGWNPPPAPGGPPGPYGYGPGPGPGPGPAPGPGPGFFPPPPPPRRKSNAGLIVGLILGIGAVVTVLIVVIVVVAVAAGAHTIGTPPASAGGLSRDYSTEGRISDDLATQRNMLRKVGGNEIEDVYTAVYGTSSVKYLFVGGNGNLDPTDLYDDFRSGVTSSTGSTSGVTVDVYRTSSGGDGEAACATARSTSSLTSVRVSVCAWATENTIGMIMPIRDPDSSLSTPPSFSYTTVASRMRLMRDDLED